MCRTLRGAVLYSMCCAWSVGTTVTRWTLGIMYSGVSGGTMARGPRVMHRYGTRETETAVPAHAAGAAAAGSLPATCGLGSHPWALEPAQPPPPSRRSLGGCFEGSRRLQGGCFGAPRTAGRMSVAHLCRRRTQLRSGRSGSRRRQCRRGASASQGRRRDRTRA
jgi:hypothetical protein